MRCRRHGRTPSLARRRFGSTDGAIAEHSQRRLSRLAGGQWLAVAIALLVGLFACSSIPAQTRPAGGDASPGAPAVATHSAAPSYWATVKPPLSALAHDVGRGPDHDVPRAEHGSDGDIPGRGPGSTARHPESPAVTQIDQF